jgi:hypothetical protein
VRSVALPLVPQPSDLHEWVSFEDPEEDRTWLFDVTFLTSDWTCIFGRGCKGVLTEDYSEEIQGCCSYGAHFTGPDDIAHTLAMAERLTPTQWQFHDEGRSGDLTVTDADGVTTTRLHEDACIFLNRPGFDGDGLGCAFHHLAEANGQRHVDVMPEVCWQVPIRRVDEVDEHGHVTSTVREWKRRDWGDGGHDFHWWCTDAPDAFVSRTPVYEHMAAELEVMTNDEVYGLLAEHLRERTGRRQGEVFLPHPARRP